MFRFGRSVFWIVLAVFGLLLGSTKALSAQETVNNASVSGRVTDPSGAVVAGAEVVARQIETNLTNTASTDSEGRFRFPYLQVGTYEIKIRRPG
jgi:protocatechuate 3,4-dioxygenase beta subunit